MELLDIRDCEPVPGMKLPFCDVKETGAVLPHSILFYEWSDPDWENKADALSDCLLAAEIDDEAAWLDEVSEPDPERERQEVLEIAEWFGCEFLFEQLPQSPTARDPFPQDAEFGSAEWYNSIKPIKF